MAALVALLVVIGNLAGGAQGMLLFGALGLAFNFGAYWFSDRFALAVNRARPVSPEEHGPPRSHVQPIPKGKR